MRIVALLAATIIGLYLFFQPPKRFLSEFINGAPGGVGPYVDSGPRDEELRIVFNIGNVAVNPKQRQPRWDFLTVNIINTGLKPVAVASVVFYCGQIVMGSHLFSSEGEEKHMLKPGDTWRDVPANLERSKHGDCEGPFVQVRATTTNGNMYSASVHRNRDGTWQF